MTPKDDSGYSANGGNNASDDNCPELRIQSKVYASFLSYCDVTIGVGPTGPHIA